MRVTFIAVAAFAACVAAIPASQARAQSASELVAKNAAARGGALKLAAITSIRFAGKLVVPGDLELQYSETRARHNGQARYESSLQGLTLVQGYDGKTAWRINPFEGRRDAERMSEDDMRALADDATIDGPLLSANARRSTVSYLGREDFEGTDTFKLRVREADGSEYVYFLDPDTFLEIKVVETRKLRGARQVTLIEYGDYEAVGGVYFPFAIERGPLDSTPAQREKLIIESAEPNVRVDPASFTMPAMPAAK